MTSWDILPLGIIKAFHLTPPPRCTTKWYLLIEVVYLHQPCFTVTVYADDTFITILWTYPSSWLFKRCLKCSSSWNDCRETMALHIALQQGFVIQQDANSKNNPLHSRSFKIVIFIKWLSWFTFPKNQTIFFFYPQLCIVLHINKWPSHFLVCIQSSGSQKGLGWSRKTATLTSHI